MNDRIKLLGEQAGGIFSPMTGMNLDNFNVIHFAELIAKECMELTRWKDFDMSTEQRIRLSICQDIKDHFGVKSD